MKILGIDPGTVSFDLCLLDNDKVTFEDSIPSRVVAERPEDLAAECLGLKPEAIIAPSGYGLPNRHFIDLKSRDFFELTLVREGDNPTARDKAENAAKNLQAAVKQERVRPLAANPPTPAPPTAHR